MDANGHKFVDLGLPSGTLWATMNVGASEPTDAGLYFQWGDTVGYTAAQVGTGDGKQKFASDWSDYKWGKNPNFTKYTTPGATLEMEDDAANKNWGGDWHMPTPEQIQELIDNTTTVWTTFNGTGMTFTSKNDTSKHIFVPAAGIATNGRISLYASGNGGIWSSMLDTTGVDNGQDIVCYGSTGLDDSEGKNIESSARCDGLSVRGVIG